MEWGVGEDAQAVNFGAGGHILIIRAGLDDLHMVEHVEAVQWAIGLIGIEPDWQSGCHLLHGYGGKCCFFNEARVLRRHIYDAALTACGRGAGSVTGDMGVENDDGPLMLVIKRMGVVLQI